MTVKAIFAEYTDLCADTALGRNILTMPTLAIEALNELMDEVEVDMTSGGSNHPDNVWINGIRCITPVDMVANIAGPETADWEIEPAAWCERHADDVERWLYENGTLLAHVGENWWFLR